jgi:hypothetical protein
MIAEEAVSASEAQAQKTQRLLIDELNRADRTSVSPPFVVTHPLNSQL